MMLRRAAIRLLAVGTLLGGMGLAGETHAAEVIKVGTLAPGASPWGQVFKVWADAVNQKSGGRVTLQFFYSGQQGDEGAMVGKIKSGQLDGAALTAVGLGKIYKPILALSSPGLFGSWAKLDSARDALSGEFTQGLRDAGVSLVGWGDVGASHLMSKSVALRTPAALKGQKPYMWRDDAIGPVFYQVIGGVSPVPLNVPEVLPQLNTGALNVVIAPALAAEQLQWSSKLDTIVSDNHALIVGGVVLSSKRLDALPADLRNIVLDTGKIAANALTKRIRSEDEAAFARLKGKTTVIALSAAERAQWDTLYKQVRQRLGQGTFPPALLTKLEALAK